MRFRKQFILCFVLALALCLCFCGCGSGTISTSEAQQYLDGENDTASAKEPTDASVDATVENEAESSAGSADMTDNSSAVATGSVSGSADSSNDTSSGSSSADTSLNSSSGSVDDTSSSGSSDSPGNSSGSSSGDAVANTGNQCTITIDCKTILNNMEKLDSAKKSIVPSDGMILKTVTVTFDEGDTVFDVLKKVTKDNKIQLEFEESPGYGGSYVEGIANLYEFDCGDTSGWEYCVNDWYPNYASSNYVLENGDVIQWRFTCDLGKDL